MTKSTIRSNLTAFIPDIAVTQAEGLDYVFECVFLEVCTSPDLPIYIL